MNIQPKVAPTGTPTISLNSGTEKRAAAIAAFHKASEAPAPTAPKQGQAQELPVRDATNISPEEMSAIAPRAQAPEPIQEDLGQPDTIEATEEKPVDPVYEQLARRERALRQKARQQEQAFKAREDALKAKEAELASKAMAPSTDLSKYIQKDILKTSPLQALAEAGLSYDELTQAILNQQPSDPRVDATINRLEAKIRQLEEANENGQKSQQAQQQAQYDAAVKQIREDAKKLVYTDPEFETVKATNSVNDVVELIEETYRKDGTLLGVEEAAKMVEDYLLEEAIKLTKIDKIKKRLSASSAQTSTKAPAQQQAASAQRQPQTMKTLSNAASTSRPLSAKERAILAFRGELK
jgi:hypothetical protein